MCRSTSASPFSSVVARFQVLFGNRVRTSEPGKGWLSARTLITVRAGLCSSAAAGMMRRTSELSTRRYSGRLPETSRVSRRMMGTPSPRRSMKYCLSVDPLIPSTGIRASTEVKASLRVAWRASMLSRVRLFGSEPGDWTSRRSSNIERRILLPRIE